MIKGQATLLHEEHRAVCGPGSLVKEENPGKGPSVSHEGTESLPLESPHNTHNSFLQIFAMGSGESTHCLMSGCHYTWAPQRPSLGSREMVR